MSCEGRISARGSRVRIPEKIAKGAGKIRGLSEGDMKNQNRLKLTLAIYVMRDGKHRRKEEKSNSRLIKIVKKRFIQFWEKVQSTMTSLERGIQKLIFKVLFRLLRREILEILQQILDTFIQ